MPDKKDIKNIKDIRNYLSKIMGRIEIFDENNRRMNKKMFAFNNVGQMINKIMSAYRKRVLRRLPLKV